MWRLLRYGLLAAVLLAVFSVGWAAYQWMDIERTWTEARPQQAETAIVLGAAVWGGRPSPAFVERLDVAVDLHRQGITRRFICTGGIGRTENGEEPLSEAEVCRQYLSAHQVPVDHILTEEASRSTWENLVNAKSVMDARGMKTAIIVTHGFHLKRALIQAHDLGINASGAPVQIVPAELAYFMQREVAALAYYHLGGRDNASAAPALRNLTFETGRKP